MKVVEFMNFTSSNVLQNNRVEVSDDGSKLEHYVNGNLRAGTVEKQNVIDYVTEAVPKDKQEELIGKLKK